MSELRDAIDEMRNMRESYDQISAAAEAYNTGKTELAANLTAKGVPASADETLPELAEKVSAIAQESYTIDGGEMYAKQLFGSLETPNYWNLYDVMAQLLSDGRLVNYGGILLAEYYRGYDSLALSGAGAGGAYVVSDKDSQGNFIMYTSDTTHVWDTAFDGKGNRWVAYCFADEYHDFQITDTNTSPRSIFIGRKVGTITSLVDGRISKIIIPDGNKCREFISTVSQNWDANVVIRNLEKIDNVIITNNAISVYLEADNISNANVVLPIRANITQPINNLIVKTKTISIPQRDTGFVRGNGLQMAIIEAEEIYLGDIASIIRVEDGNASPLKEVIFLGIEKCNGGYPVYANNNRFAQRLPNYRKLYIGYATNDKTKSVWMLTPVSVTDIEIQDGWNKPLTITGTGQTEENMYAHILQRLKQDEADCGDGVTITLGSTNLAKLTSAESVALLDSLTNTYGYTFA